MSQWLASLRETADQNHRAPQLLHRIAAQAKTNPERLRAMPLIMIAKNTSEESRSIFAMPTIMDVAPSNANRTVTISFHHWPLDLMTDRLNIRAT